MSASDPTTLPDAAPAPAALRRISRAALRQLAAAVYARIAFALVASVLPASWVAIHAASFLSTGLSAALLTFAVEGVLLESGLVGFACAAFDLGVGWVLLGAGTSASAFLVEHGPPALDEAVAGLLGAWLVLRARSKKALSQASQPPADEAP